MTRVREHGDIVSEFRLRSPQKATGKKARLRMDTSRQLAKCVREQRLDRRTWLAHFIEQTEGLLMADSGGPENCTNREKLLISMASMLWSEYQLIAWRRQQAILHGEQDHASDKYYIAHVNAVRRTLEAIGLRPQRADQLPSLADYLAARGAVDPLTIPAESTTADPGSGSTTAPALRDLSSDLSSLAADRSGAETLVAQGLDAIDVQSVSLHNAAYQTQLEQKRLEDQALTSINHNPDR